MMMSATTNEPKRIHPHKFTLWVAIGAMCMSFAGLTSAYIVKKNQSSWLEFELPVVFWYSTLAILLSSLTMHLSVKAFKAREMGRYRNLLSVTAVLGLIFITLQYLGFQELEAKGIALIGTKSNSAASFLFVITGLHMVHVLGGVIALLVIFIRAFSSKTKSYSPVPVEIAATYWHFVDILWIYLFIFYNWIG
jgi:cytochrome c oxidase subunit 3